jgi:hypothetical protein
MPINSKILCRGLIVWLIIIVAESVHGILRVLLLEPLVGDFRARQIAVFTGAIIVLTLSIAFVRWFKSENLTQLFAIGLLWITLTIAFEILLGRFVANLPWERIASDYNLFEGGLLPLGLLSMLFSPIVAGKIRKVI